ncbi:TetR/AcrR family transcriptional regulator [Gemmatimonas groenlandica]|uniref:TetR/AcrR family transcriptional regulator n=1 Tax=Gemmatimonas groenlandica TaxID=2732249 RepID=A0A6M4IZQ8_9BACT|nr:TetR/AcrR family transcriptional regulator [Gemmatimonas groenlandica]QJR37691.1 TetR/AcrR family transcriptional regulator [Gemmatimonas groenlandica]
MPAIAKTSADEIAIVAGTLLEQGGIDAVSMHAIARALGIRAPSLYKHFPDRSALLEHLALVAFTALGERIALAASAEDAFGAMAIAYRTFAHESPQHYQHMMSAQTSQLASIDHVRAQAAAPVLAYLAPIVGRARALTVARLLTAYLHGYVTMELTGAFRLGGDPAADFAEGLALLRTVVVSAAANSADG